MKQSKKLLALAAVLLAASLLCAACGYSPAGKAQSTAAYAPSAAPQEMSRMDTTTDFAPSKNDAGAEASGTAMQEGGISESALLSAQTGAADPTRKIIYDATLQMEALNYDATCKALLDAMKQVGGYVSSTTMSAENYEGAARYATYTFRIPTDRYSTFLTAMGQAGNVTMQQENTQDITAEYVDVEARLNSLRTQEERLLAMLESAGELETLLAVQNQLTEVQYKIESYTAQQRTYDTLVAYSTVTVDVREVKRITEQAKETFGARVGLAFRESWVGFADGCQQFAVSLVYALPTLLVIALLLGILGIIGRSAWKKHIKQKAAQALVPQAAQQSKATDVSAPAQTETEA